MMKELRIEAVLYLRMKNGESEETATARLHKILDENGIEFNYFESHMEDD